MFDINKLVEKFLPSLLKNAPNQPLLTYEGLKQTQELAALIKEPIPPEHLHEVLVLFVGKLALDRMDVIAGGLKVLTDKLSAKLNEKEAQDARK